jgi:endo-alpha-1,4-polygalactosaminidase (GH114 family)
VVDVYSYWQSDAPDDEKVADADDKMVDFVADIREHL